MATLTSVEEQLLQKIQSIKSQTPKSHNEEFITYNSCDSIPNVTPGFLTTVNKTKFARKSQTDFFYTCTEIIRKISKGSIQAANHIMDSENDYFIYSDMFISKSKSNSDNWRVPAEDVEMATFSVVNTELRNLQQVIKAKIPGVNFINTVLVDRLGERFILQNLLEGMLYFNPKEWGKYGSFDEGKTFNNDEEFAPIFKKLCESLWISQDNNFEFENKKLNIHGSAEVKGIVAGDGRKYIMDLLRISPRDLNFKDQVEHQSCVLRPELIKNYQVIQSWKKVYEMRKKKQEQEKEKAEEKKGELKTGESENELSEKKEEKVELKVATPLTLNTSLFTNIVSKNEEAKHKEDVKNLEKMAEYLVKEAIPGVMAELTDKNSRFSVIDCESLIQVMHKNGVNTRYLGNLLDLVSAKPNGEETQEDFPVRKGYEWVQQLVQFTIMIRSFVKVLRELVKKYKHENSVEVILHCLNLLLGDEGVRRELQKKYLGAEAKDLPSENTEQVSSTLPEEEKPLRTKKGKRKRKRKNKKKVISQKSEESPQFESEWFKLSKPSLKLENSFKSLSYSYLIQRTLEIAGKKYSFKGSHLPLKLLVSCHDKLRFLREIFTKFALKLNPKSTISFKVEDSLSKGAFRAPLRSSDVTEIGFKVKGIDYNIEEIAYNIMAADKDFKKGNVQRAINSLQIYLPIMTSIYGMFHVEVVKLLVRLGSFFVQTKQVSKAISYQTLAFLISLRLNGPQDINTANSLNHLSNSLFLAERYDTSLQTMKFILKTWDLIGGQLNPLSFNCLTEMQRIALKVQDLSLLEKILNELQKRNSKLYGKADQRNLGWLSQLARLKSTKGDFKGACELQTKHSFILRQLIRKYEHKEEEENQKKEEIQENKDKSKVQDKNSKFSYLNYFKANLQEKFKESEKLKNFYQSRKN